MKTKKIVLNSLGVLIILLFLAALLQNYLTWKNNYADKIYPGVKIGNLSLGGKTLSEAQEIISAKTRAIEENGLNLQYGDKQVALSSGITSFDSDLSYQIFVYDAETSANQAMGDQKKHTFINYLLNKFGSRYLNPLQAAYTLDELKLKKAISDNFKELNIDADNAYFSLDKNGQLKNNPEKLGKKINYDQLFLEIKNNLNNLENPVFIIKTQTEYPQIKQADLGGLENEAASLAKQGDLILTFSENNDATLQETWKIKPEKLITWIGVNQEGGVLRVSLDANKIKEYLSLTIAPKIDKESVRPRFEINNGRVSSWQTGLNGRQIDLEASASQIIQKFLAGERTISLITKEITANDLTPDNNLNIKELIGTGHSNFAGSPSNRRHNIAVGSAAIHGLLIKPGEEFSLVKALGAIDASTGYLPELVIKGNKTIPEYGGGLCQVGTTVFRSALASGLPITARQNHSYRVSYYEPAGMDAAVYDPWPDIRFVNDTGNYILIQTRTIKDDLYFDFWGTKDGRVASTTKPVVYNIIKPGPTKLIETDTLAAGQKKCTEKAHNGADAYFDYTVTYPANATTSPIQATRFKSHYVPWPEVCLIGASATTSPGIISSSSSQVLNSDNQKATSSTPAATSTSL